MLPVISTLSTPPVMTEAGTVKAGLSELKAVRCGAPNMEHPPMHPCASRSSNSCSARVSSATPADAAHRSGGAFGCFWSFSLLSHLSPVVRMCPKQFSHGVSGSRRCLPVGVGVRESVRLLQFMYFSGSRATYPAGHLVRATFWSGQAQTWLAE